jgi:hypothetical protein
MLGTDEITEIDDLHKELGAVLLLLLFVGDTSRPRPTRDVAWSAQRGVFLVDGKAVMPETLRRLVQIIELKCGARAKKHTQDLIDRKITLDEWKQKMERTVSAGHWMAAALALGGLLNSRGSIDLHSRINQELGYLNRFAYDVKAGKVSDAQKQSRSRSYFRAIALTFGILQFRSKKQRATAMGITPMERDVMSGSILQDPLSGDLTAGAGGIFSGFTGVEVWAIRRRTAGESCPDCIFFSDRWMPIGEMPELGSLQCRHYCKCVIEYK